MNKLEKQKARRQMAQDIRNERERKLANQRACAHQHNDGTTHCVHVLEQNGPGYVLCQKLQCVIRNGRKPKNYQGTAIYNSKLFQKLLGDIHNPKENPFVAMLKKNLSSTPQMLEAQAYELPMSELEKRANQQLSGKL